MGRLDFTTIEEIIDLEKNNFKYRNRPISFTHN